MGLDSYLVRCFKLYPRTFNTRSFHTRAIEFVLTKNYCSELKASFMIRET